MLEKSGYIAVVFQCQPHVVHFRVQRDVRLYGHQLVAQPYVPSRGLELFPLPGGEFVEMIVDVLHAAVFSDQPGSPDFPDSLYARHIVGRVPADGQHLDDLQGGTYAISGADGILVEDFRIFSRLAGTILEDTVIHELTVVLVGSHHVDVRVRGLHPPCHGTDDVVSLESRHHQHRDVKRPAQFLQRFESFYDKLGSLVPVGLVLRIHLIPESASGRVECHGKMRRLFPVYHFQEILGESEKDGRVLSLGVYHRTPQECVVHLEDQCVSVYEE